MENIRVNLTKKIDDSYDIVISKGMFPAVVDGLSKLNLGKITIITDSNVKKLYGEKLLKMFKQAEHDVVMVSFPQGESNKTRKTKEKIEDVLIGHGLKRDSVIIALGGGVVGDMAGFVASTYMRGISYLQIPTTLLSMVDSSIGGKTGLDTPQGKNMIGTFYQPKKVFIDIDVLKSLPKDELLNGIAEMIKHAIISDEKFFVFIQDYISRMLSFDDLVLIKSIKWSIMVKKSIVESDEREEGIRKILNFGHTIGHAIEKSSNYSLSHGNAVAMGMIAETKIAKELGLINQVQADKILGTITSIGFNLSLKGIDINEVIANTKYDKKNIGQHVRYVLPTKIGKMEIDVKVEEDIVKKVLGEMN